MLSGPLLVLLGNPSVKILNRNLNNVVLYFSVSIITAYCIASDLESYLLSYIPSNRHKTEYEVVSICLLYVCFYTK